MLHGRLLHPMVGPVVWRIQKTPSTLESDLSIFQVDIGLALVVYWFPGLIPNICFCWVRSGSSHLCGASSGVLFRFRIENFPREAPPTHFYAPVTYPTKSFPSHRLDGSYDLKR